MLDRGQPGTALFTLAGTQVEFAPGIVRWDGEVPTIDATALAARDTGILRFQLLNSDTDLGSKVTIRPLTNEVDPVGTAQVIPAGATALTGPGGPLVLAGLAVNATLVVTSSDSVLTHFVYDRDNVLLDFVDSDGASGPDPAVLDRRYLHGPAADQVLAQENTAGGVLWLLADHLGSVTDLIDSAGNVVNHLQYDSYGNVIAESNPAAASRYRYTGREYDRETGLQYHRARYYDTSIGRFLGEDPIAFGGGDTNLYAYTGNSPVAHRDPSGRDLVPERVPANLQTQIWDVQRQFEAEMMHYAQLESLKQRLDASQSDLYKALNDLIERLLHPQCPKENKEQLEKMIEALRKKIKEVDSRRQEVQSKLESTKQRVQQLDRQLKNLLAMQHALDTIQNGPQ